MNLARTPYLFPQYLSVAVCWFLAFYALRRRHVAAALPFFAVMFSAGFWALFYGLELIAPSLESKLIFFNLKQLGASAIGPSLLYIGLHYTNQRVRYTKLLFALILIEPIGSQLIFWTNSWHGLGGTPSLVTGALPFPVLIFDFGPWFWLSIFVGYFFLAITILIFLTRLPGANVVYRKQILLILFSLIPPWLVGTLGVFGVGNLEFLDATTFLFPISGILMGLGVFRYQLLKLAPVGYSAVIASIRDGIIIVDEKFYIIELNPAALRLLGQRKKVVTGQHISEIFPIWDQSILDKPQNDEYRTLKFYHEQGGQYRYLEVHGAFIESSANVTRGHVLILYDVTDQTLAEKASQVSEARYRTIFETDSAATVILDEDMTISLANTGFVALSGYERHEVEGKMQWTEFVHPEDLQAMQNYHQARREEDNQAPNEYEFRFIDKEGQLKDVFLTVALVPGSTISVASLLDITKRKLAEQLLQERATALEAAVRSEQERSAIILQSVHDAIAVSDLSLKTIYVNKAFSTLTGYDLEEILGEPAAFILNGRVPQLIWRSLQDSYRDQTIWEGELQFKRKDGSVYDAAVLIAPMRDGTGKLVGFVSSHRDITEAKRLDESRRHFVTNVSHQLRTPVTNIRLYVDLLQRHFETTRREHYFATLNEQIERLEIIIQNTVEIAALEEGHKVLARQPIQWATLSENLQIRLQQQADDKNISLHFLPGLAQLPTIIGDTQRIFQAIYELIHNAIIFIHPGGNVFINGTVSPDTPQWLTISVCDDGPGIAPSDQTRIFERLYRGKQVDTGHVPGTGLGLSMATLIAQAHNGRLTVESELGKGSTFTLWLPLN